MTDPSPPAQHPTPDRSDEPGADPPVEPAWALSRMAGLVLSPETVETALELVTTLAATTTAGTSGAAVTLVDEHGKRSKAASSAAAERADALQYEFDEGPCLTAWQTGELVRIDDTTTDGRWPRWNAAASRLGVRSVLSTPLLGVESIGAMKVYCERPMSYGPHDERVMRLLASQAAILLADTRSLAEARRLSRRLADALAGRDAVAQATGVLLAQGASSREDAFAALAAAANRTGHPVETIARALLTDVTSRSGSRAAG